MLSDDSDVSAISSDDNAGQTTKAHKKTGYRLRNVLKPGRTTQYTAKALYDQIHDNDIDLDPEYQRDVVWSEAKQIGLIDSIFRNFYVPPIIFAVTTEDDGTEKRVCIDGKQRLTSIQKFIGGLIPHRDPFTNERLWFVDSTSGPKRKLLPPQYKTLFQNKQIVCIEYSELPPDLEREVFQRVQMGMALTTAEKMQAISGPWPDLVREITNEYYLCADGISENMDLNHARARDFQNLAQTIYCIDQLPAQVHGTTMQIEKWLTREEQPSVDNRKRLHDVFEIFREIARNKQLKTPLKKPSRVAPAEFIMIGVLIAMYKDRLSLPQLSQAISILRTETRAMHADIRTNSTVFKTMFSVLSNQIKALTSTELPGSTTAGTSGASATMNIVGSGKRKRHESTDGDSSEEGRQDRKDNIPKSRMAPQNNLQNTVITKPSLVATGSPSGFPMSLDTSADVKAEGSGSGFVLPPNSSLSSNGNPYIPTGLSRFARIQAAKAQAAKIATTTGAGLSPTDNPHSFSPQQPFQIPRAQSQPPTKTLEATMMAPVTRQIDPQPRPSAPPNAPTQPRNVGLQSRTIGMPKLTNGVDLPGVSRPTHGMLNRQHADGHTHRERHGSNNYQNRDWDRGPTREQDSGHSRDPPQSTYPTRNSHPNSRDAGWPDRDRRSFRESR